MTYSDHSPERNSERGDKSEKEEIIQPEIIIDDSQGTEEQPEEELRGFREEAQRLQTFNPIFLRTLSLIGSFFAFFFAIGVFCYFSLSFIIAAGNLFQNANINQKTKSVWKLLVYSIIVFFSLFFGIFSPIFGLAFLILYFTIKNDKQHYTSFKRKFDQYT